MKVLLLHHVTVKVGDIDVARTFYGDVLGLLCRTDGPAKGPSGAWFDLGDRQLHLSVGAVSPSDGQHFALVIDAFVETVDSLRQHGVEVLRSGDAAATITDPFGNQIELRGA